MKAILFTTILTYLAIALPAQEINYTIDNLANAGDVFHVEKISYETDEMPNIETIDSEGWDFSSINTLNKEMVSVLSKNDFEELVDLPEGTIVMEQDENRLCLLPENNYLKLLGILANVEGTNIPMLFPEPINMLHFPLTVGEADQNSFSFPIAGKPSDFGLSIPLHDSIKILVHITSSTQVQNKGNLITHQYNYDAFKIQNTTILAADIYAKPIFGGWYLYEENAVTDSTKILQYYTPQYGIPVCEITMNWNNEIKSFQIIDENFENIVASHQLKPSLYPNPVRRGETIFIEKELSNIIIYNTQGQVIQQIKRAQQLNTTGLQPGLYFINSTDYKKGIKVIVKH